MELFAEDIGTHTYTCSLFYMKPLYVNPKKRKMGMPHLDRPDKARTTALLVKTRIKGFMLRIDRFNILIIRVGKDVHVVLSTHHQQRTKVLPPAPSHHT